MRETVHNTTVSASTEAPAAPSDEVKHTPVAARVDSFATAGKRVLASPAVVPAVITVGIVLRVVRFLHDRSLWLDESLLAANLMTRSYTHLFGTLDFDQGAPVGFLMLEKLAISTFGDGERAFRLFPFLAGLAALPAFWLVARRFVGRAPAVLALAFFAVMQPFIYYSTETKQYSFDVLVTLVLLWLFAAAVEKTSVTSFVALGAAGLAAPWFSHPSVFVLAGIGTALFLQSLVNRRFVAAGVAAAAGIAWMLSFGVEYITSIRRLGHLATVVRGVSEGDSVLKTVYTIFSQPGALPRTLVGFAVFLVAAGVVALTRRSWPLAVALAVMTLVAMYAGSAGRYPLGGRWALFLLPGALLCLGLGAASLVAATAMPLRAVLVVAVAVLLLAPTAAALQHAHRLPTAEPGTPALLEPTKPLLGRLADRWRPGDTLYVSVKSQYAFRYYLTCHDCNARQEQERTLWPIRPIPGPTLTSPSFVPLRRSLVLGSPREDLASYLADFRRLRGKARVWFFFSHTPPVDESVLEQALDRQGRKLVALRDGAASVLLYDLRP